MVVSSKVIKCYLEWRPWDFGTAHLVGELDERKAFRTICSLIERDAYGLNFAAVHEYLLETPVCVSRWRSKYQSWCKL